MVHWTMFELALSVQHRRLSIRMQSYHIRRTCRRRVSSQMLSRIRRVQLCAATVPSVYHEFIQPCRHSDSVVSAGLQVEALGREASEHESAKRALEEALAVERRSSLQRQGASKAMEEAATLQLREAFHVRSSTCDCCLSKHLSTVSRICLSGTVSQSTGREDRLRVSWWTTSLTVIGGLSESS